MTTNLENLLLNQPVPAVSSVTDGITTVDPATSLDFTSGAVVTDLGGGVAGVAISGGGGGTVTNVSSADSSIVVTNPSTTPVLQLASLDVIAANEPAVADVDLNAQKIVNLADGVNPQDAATVAQLSVGGIQFGVANSGSYLDIEVTSADGLGNAVLIHDTGPASQGINLISDNSNVNLTVAAASQVNLVAGASFLAVNGAGNNISGALLSGGEYLFWDSSFVPLIEATDARTLGFLGATPVAQQATPVTLGDVIAILQAFGFAA